MYQLKLTAVRLKKGTAQWFISANLARIFINLSWYDSTMYQLKLIKMRGELTDLDHCAVPFSHQSV